MNETTSPQPLKSAKLPPLRKPNSQIRSREYLSVQEIDKIRKAARQGRYGHRNDMLIFMMFRHGLRNSEVVRLKWEQIEFDNALLHVKRLKNGVDSTHPLSGEQLRSLRKLKREQKESAYVFTTERGAPCTTRVVHHIVAQAGQRAGLLFSIHPHMLRHSTGFYLANKGVETRAIQLYLGHRNINNTVMYTQLSANRFKEFWDD